MPASTSSNTSVGTRSSRARIVFSASITRDSSPPDATRDSGRGSCPTLSATQNSTSSAPFGPISPAVERDGEMSVGHPEIRQHLVDRARQSLGAALRAARSAAPPSRPSAARASRSRVSSCRMSSPAESTRSSSARASLPVSNDARQRAAVLLRQPEQHVAPAPHVLESLRIELHGRLVLLELARQRLDRVVRRHRTTPAAAPATDRCAESP